MKAFYEKHRLWCLAALLVLAAAMIVTGVLMQRRTQRQQLQEALMGRWIRTIEGHPHQYLTLTVTEGSMEYAYVDKMHPEESDILYVYAWEAESKDEIAVRLENRTAVLKVEFRQDPEGFLLTPALTMEGQKESWKREE